MIRIGDRFELFNEVLPVTSAAGATSLEYDMSGCNSITFVCGLGTVAAASTVLPQLSVRQSGDRGFSTSGALTGATAIPGPTTANQVARARSVVVTMGTASTLTNTLVLNGATLTYSTAPAATALTFGSTEGSTVADGIANAVNSLASVINASTHSGLINLTAATISTAAIRIVAHDTADTSIALASTAAAAFALVQEQGQSIIEVFAQDLDSTSRYVALRVTTATTACVVSVTAIRDTRYLPPYQLGQHVKTT